MKKKALCLCVLVVLTISLGACNRSQNASDVARRIFDVGVRAIDYVNSINNKE